MTATDRDALVVGKRRDGLRLPPVVVDRIGTAQIFTFGTTEKKRLAERDFIWGDNDRATDLSYRTRYVPYDREPDKTRDLAWYQQHAPQSVARRCDHEPAVTYRYDWGFLTPLDITNPEVRSSIFERYVRPAKAAGFDGIAFDNVTGNNESKRCGISRGAQWVPMFSGSVLDRAFTEAVRDWVAWMREQAHAIGLSAAINLFYYVRDPEAFAIVAREADIVVDEGGYTRDCAPRLLGGDWVRRFLIMRQVARERALVTIDQACADFAKMPPAIVEWSLVNYHLERGERSYLALVGYGEYGRFLDRPELHIRLGRAVEDAAEAGGLWVRRYERGGVALNPGGEPAPLELPEGQWQRLDGTRISGAVLLRPGEALLYEQLKDNP